MVLDKKAVAKELYLLLLEEGVSEGIHHLREKIAGEKTGKIGLTKTPVLNSIGDELGKLLLNKKEWFDILLEAWNLGGRDERLVVISALGRIARKDYSNVKRFVEKVLNDIDDWEICDQMALRVIIRLLLSNQEEMFSVLNEWKNSDNKWIRRLAIASIPPFIRAKKEEALLCVSFLEDIIGKEKDKDVIKAISWALREISKKSPETVYGFLLEWVEKSDTPQIKRIIKDGMKKLPLEKQAILKKKLSV